MAVTERMLQRLSWSRKDFMPIWLEKFGVLSLPSRLDGRPKCQDPPHLSQDV